MTIERDLWERVVMAVETGQAAITNITRDMTNHWIELPGFYRDEINNAGMARRSQRITIEIIVESLPGVASIAAAHKLIDNINNAPSVSPVLIQTDHDMRTATSTSSMPKTIPTVTLAPYSTPSDSSPRPPIRADQSVRVITPPPPKEPEKPKELEDDTSKRFSMMELD